MNDEEMEWIIPFYKEENRTLNILSDDRNEKLKILGFELRDLTFYALEDSCLIYEFSNHITNVSVYEYYNHTNPLFCFATDNDTYKLEILSKIYAMADIEYKMMIAENNLRESERNER